VPPRLTGCELTPQQAARLLGRIARGAAWECWTWQGAADPGNIIKPFNDGVALFRVGRGRAPPTLATVTA